MNSAGGEKTFVWKIMDPGATRNGPSATEHSDSAVPITFPNRRRAVIFRFVRSQAVSEITNLGTLPRIARAAQPLGERCNIVGWGCVSIIWILSFLTLCRWRETTDSRAKCQGRETL